MKNFQSLTFWKKPSIILALILAVFFLKGVFLAILFPIFSGQDEARHYNTIQYLAEPKNAVLNTEKDPRTNNNSLVDKDNFDTYNFSEEIQKVSAAANVNILRGDIFNTQIFSDNFDGQNEGAINSNDWKPYNYYSNPDIASGGYSLYHKIASQIEKFFSAQNMLVRFYLIRIFSVLLGAFAILLSYFIAKTIGFSSKHALLLAAIISFQPKFSIYFTNINYDVLLIPMFFLFTLAGAYALKKGLNWKNLLLLIFSIVVAVQTKPTGYILAVIFIALIAYLLYEKVRLKTKRLKYSIYGLSFFAFFSIVYYLYSHFLVTSLSLGETITSISDYISRTITFSKFVLPSETYWGTLSWTNSLILNNVTNLIFIIETAAIIGLGPLLFSKKLSLKYPNFLPAKKYILFLIGMLAVLQFGIRTADWHVFNQIGGMKMSLGTPGRYFLPNLAAHIILVFTGIGALLAYFKKEKYFDYSLITGLILMMTLMLYTIFDVMLLRFYL